MSFNWHGLFPALWTPTDDSGALMKDELTAQVRFLRANGADGLMVLGSTGQFVHLDLAARRDVLRTVADLEPGWPLIANVSDVDPRQVAALGRFAREVNAHAVSLLPPWFYRFSAEDVTEFLVRGAEAAGLPLIVYNFPERTGHRLSMETVAAVCDRVRVVALKQSGAEFAYHRELAQLGQEKGFTLITGADTRIPEAHALGARAVVSGLANAVPEWVGAVLRAVLNGGAPGATAEEERLASLAAAIQGLEFPIDVAAAMEARGRPTGELKQALSPGTLSRFRQAVGTGRALMARWGLI